MNKYLMKDEFLLRGMKLWNFIFDKGLFQQSGEKVVYSQHKFDRTQKSAFWVRLLVFLKT